MESNPWVANDERMYQTRKHQSRKGEASLLLVKWHKIKDSPPQLPLRVDLSLVDGR